MRRGPIRHEKEGKVITPMPASFVASASHAHKGAVKALNDSNGLMVLRGRWTQVHSSLTHD